MQDLIPAHKQSQAGEVPTPYEYAVMSEWINIPKDKSIEEKLKARGWELCQSIHNTKSGYAGAAWIKHSSRHVVIAHSGTSFLNNLSQMKQIAYDDVSQIMQSQAAQAVAFTDSVIGLLKNADKKVSISKQFPDYTLSFTGHALGGYYAIFAARYFYETYQAGAVVFDAPGADSLQDRLQSNLTDKNYQFDFADLSIINYLSPPNVINTCNKHAGRLIHIFPKTKNHERSKIAKYFFYHLDQIDITAIRNEFDATTGEAKFQKEIVDWPLMKWDALNSLTTGAMRSPLVEVAFGIAKGVDALVGVAIGVIEDIRNNILASYRVGEQYYAAHQFLDSQNSYKPNENLTQEERFKQEIIGKYRLKDMAKEDEDKEILTRELHPSVKNFLWDLFNYPLSLSDYPGVFTPEEIHCLSSYAFSKQKQKKIIIKGNISPQHFIQTLSRLTFNYSQNSDNKFDTLKSDIKTWKGKAEKKLSSYILELDNRLKQIEENKLFRFECSVNQALIRSYKNLKIETPLGKRVDISTLYIPTQIIESMTISNKNRKVIVGEPGSGKSTLSKYIAQTVSEGVLWEGQFDFVFLIPLSNINTQKYGPNPTLDQIVYFECFHGEIPSEDWRKTWYERFASNQNILYLLDGFDENTELNQSNTMPAWFKNLINKNNVILTARTTRNLMLDDTWDIHKLPGFNETDITLYIDKYFCNNGLEKSLKDFIRKNKQLINSLKTPIHLEMLCAIFERSNGNIPQLTVLYEGVLDLLLRIYLGRTTLSERVSNRLSTEVVDKSKNILLPLKYIAANAIKENKTLYTSQEFTDFLKKFSGTTGAYGLRQNVIKSHFISTYNEGIIENDAKYFFTDEVIKKYLAALYWYEKIIDDDVETKETIRQKRHDPEFELILLFISGMFGENDSGNTNKQQKQMARKAFLTLLNKEDNNENLLTLNLLILKIRCLFEMANPDDLKDVNEAAHNQLALLTTNPDPAIKLNAAIAQIQHDSNRTEEHRNQKLVSVFSSSLLQEDETAQITLKALHAFAHTHILDEIAHTLKNRLTADLTHLTSSERFALFKVSFLMIIEFEQYCDLLLAALNQFLHSSVAHELASAYKVCKDGFSEAVNNQIGNSWITALQDPSFDNVIKVFNFLCSTLNDDNKKSQYISALEDILCHLENNHSIGKLEIAAHDEFIRILTDDFVNNRDRLLAIGNCGLLYELLMQFGMSSTIPNLVNNLIQLARENESEIKVIESLAFITYKHNLTHVAQLFLQNMQQNENDMHVYVALLESTNPAALTLLANQDEFINLIFTLPFQNSLMSYIHSPQFEILTFIAAHMQTSAIEQKILPVLEQRATNNTTKKEYFIQSAIKEMLCSTTRNKAHLFLIAIELLKSENLSLNDFAYVLFENAKNCHPDFIDSLLARTVNYLEKNIYFNQMKIPREEIMLRNGNQDVNKNFKDILFKNTEEFVCYAYIAKSLSEARARLVELNVNASMYVFAEDSLYYISSQDNIPVNIPLAAHALVRVRNNLRNDILALPDKQDIELVPATLNETQVKQLTVDTSHSHPDDLVQEERALLYGALLKKGQFLEEWDKDRAIIATNINTQKKIIAAELNILFNFISSILAKEFSEVHDVFNPLLRIQINEMENIYDNNLIEFHYQRKEHYQLFKDALTQVILSKSTTAASSNTQQGNFRGQERNPFLEPVENAFKPNQDEEIGRGVIRTNLDTELNTILIKEKRRISRSLFIDKNRCQESAILEFSTEVNHSTLQLTTATNALPIDSILSLLSTTQNQNQLSSESFKEVISTFAINEKIHICFWRIENDNLVSDEDPNEQNGVQSHYPTDTLHLLQATKPNHYYILIPTEQANDEQYVLTNNANNQTTEKRINDYLDDLKSDLHQKALATGSYAAFIIKLLNKIENLSTIGHHTIERKADVIKFRNDHYTALEDQFDNEVGNSVLGFPYIIRKELYMDGEYKDSEFYKIECMRDLRISMMKSDAKFFLWPIAYIRHYINALIDKKILKDNIINLIGELSHHYNSTVYYWSKFENLHAITRTDWEKQWGQLLNEYKDTIFDALVIKFDKKSKFNHMSIAEIQIYIDKNRENIASDIFGFIDNLSNYYDYTLAYYDDFKARHRIELKEWQKQIFVLVKQNDLYRLLFQKSDVTGDDFEAYDNSSFARLSSKMRKFSDPSEVSQEMDPFLRYKKEFDQLLKGGNVSLNIFAIENATHRLEKAFPNRQPINENTWNALVINYVYESLYHVDILFQSPSDASNQYMIKQHLLFKALKNFYFPRSTENTFINEYIGQITDKINTNHSLLISDIIALLYSYRGAIPSFNFDNLLDFKRNIYNHHVTKLMDGFRSNCTQSRDDLRTSVRLLRSKIVQNKSYHIPNTTTTLENQNTTMQKILQVQDAENEQGILQRTSAHSEKLKYSLERANAINNKLNELIMAFNSPENYQKLSSANSLKNLYDIIIISMLYALPTEYAGLLAEKYERSFVGINDGFNGILATLLKSGQPRTPLDELIYAYFYTPLSEFENKFKEYDNLLHPIIARHRIAEKLVKLLQEQSNSQSFNFSRYTENYLSYLRELLNNSWLSLEIVTHDRNASPLLGVNKLIYEINLFFKSHYMSEEKLRSLISTLEQLILSLDLGSDEETRRVVSKINAKITEYGWVATDLCPQPALVPADVLVARRPKLLQLMREGNLSEHSLLFSLLLNEGHLVSESDIEAYIASSPKIQLLKEVCLYSHTEDSNGKTLLANAIDHNCAELARRLIITRLTALDTGDNDEQYSAYKHFSIVMGQEREKLIIQYFLADKRCFSNSNAALRSSLMRELNAVANDHEKAEIISNGFPGLLLDNNEKKEVQMAAIDAIQKAKSGVRAKYHHLRKIILLAVLSEKKLDQTVYNFIYAAKKGGENYKALINEWREQTFDLFRNDTTSKKRLEFIQEVEEEAVDALIDGTIEAFTNWLRDSLDRIKSNQSWLHRSRAVECYEAAMSPVGGLTKISSSSSPVAQDRQTGSATVIEVHQNSEDAQWQATNVLQAREQERQAREAAEQRAADERKGRLRAEFYAKFNDFEILRHRTSDDNNSQFQAVQHAYNQVSSGSGSSTVDLRQRVIAYIKTNDEFAKEVLGDDASPYLNQLAQPTTAGDAVSLTALAKILGHAIIVLKPSGNETQLIHVDIIYPRVGETLNVDNALLLIFDGEQHYDSCKLRGNDAFKEFITAASLQQSQNMLTKPLINRGYHQQAGAGAESRAGAASSSQNQGGQQFTHSFTS